MRKRTRRRHFDLDANAVRLAMLPRHVRADELRDLRILELMSLDRVLNGSAGASDVRTLRRSVKIAGKLAEAGIGPEVSRLVPGALAVLDGWQPGIATGPAGVEALRQLLELYDDQRQAATRAEYERAIHAVVHPHG